MLLFVKLERESLTINLQLRDVVVTIVTLRQCTKPGQVLLNSCFSSQPLQIKHMNNRRWNRAPTIYSSCLACWLATPASWPGFLNNFLPLLEIASVIATRRELWSPAGHVAARQNCHSDIQQTNRQSQSQGTYRDSHTHIWFSVHACGSLSLPVEFSLSVSLCVSPCACESLSVSVSIQQQSHQDASLHHVSPVWVCNLGQPARPVVI